MTNLNTDAPTEEMPQRKRGRPKGSATAPKAPRKVGIPNKESADFEEDMIAYRLVKECERLEREGRVVNRTWLEQKLQMNRQGLAMIRAGKRSYKGVHLRNLKLVFNGDVQFVLFGVEDPDHSLPYKVKGGARVRIDVYEPYTFDYKEAAAWRVGQRREGDDERRFEASYYRGKDTELEGM